MSGGMGTHKGCPYIGHPTPRRTPEYPHPLPL